MWNNRIPLTNFHTPHAWSYWWGLAWLFVINIFNILYKFFWEFSWGKKLSLVCLWKTVSVLESCVNIPSSRCQIFIQLIPCQNTSLFRLNWLLCLLISHLPWRCFCVDLRLWLQALSVEYHFSGRTVQAAPWNFLGPILRGLKRQSRSSFLSCRFVIIEFRQGQWLVKRFNKVDSVLRLFILICLFYLLSLLHLLNLYVTWNRCGLPCWGNIIVGESWIDGPQGRVFVEKFVTLVDALLYALIVWVFQVLELFVVPVGDGLKALAHEWFPALVLENDEGAVYFYDLLFPAKADVGAVV